MARKKMASRRRTPRSVSEKQDSLKTLIDATTVGTLHKAGLWGGHGTMRFQQLSHDLFAGQLSPEETDELEDLCRRFAPGRPPTSETQDEWPVQPA